MAFLLCIPCLARGHTGAPIGPHDLWGAWTFAPVVITAIALTGVCYGLGTRTLWQRTARRRRVVRRRAVAFGSGLLALTLALLSPIDAASSALFSVHMMQHLLLVVVAAPLLVLGEPQYVMLWALPPEDRRRVARWWWRAGKPRAFWRVVSVPLVAWSLHIATLWLWHVPKLYDAALRDGRIHVLEHTSFLLTALLFWWVVLDRRALRVGPAAFYVFAASLQGTLLGALLTIARHPWYTAHYGTTTAWGLTPLEDQQLAGLIMWIPPGMVYLLAIAPRLVKVLRDLNSPTSSPPMAKKWRGEGNPSPTVIVKQRSRNHPVVRRLIEHPPLTEQDHG